MLLQVSLDQRKWFHAKMNNGGSNEWLSKQVCLSPNRYKLIRRRVIWLIGQWIPVKFKSDLRPVLYEIILNLMQDPDLVVSTDRQ